MQVVIFGDREDQSVKKEDIDKLLTSLSKKYSDLTIISAACDKGIGSYVKDRCLQEKTKSKPDFAFVEVSLKIWAIQAKPILARTYMSRHATLLELGEEFHLFIPKGKKSQVQDMYDRVVAAHRPVYLYPVETLQAPEQQTPQQQSILSGEISDLLKEE